MQENGVLHVTSKQIELEGRATSQIAKNLIMIQYFQYFFTTKQNNFDILPWEVDNWAWTKANLVSLGVFGLVFWAWGGPFGPKCVVRSTCTPTRKADMTNILGEILG